MNDWAIVLTLGDGTYAETQARSIAAWLRQHGFEPTVMQVESA